VKNEIESNEFSAKT